MKNLSGQDPQIAEQINNEVRRQQNGLEMIASENIVSEAVLEAMGTPLTNKYSEGYPGKRYYGGNEFIDVIENLARERACKLFGAEHANVQPHAGSPANMAAYFAMMEPGDKLMAMSLAHGGHLTHGSPVNFSGKLYKIIPYGVREDNHMIDMDEVREIALREKPRVILAGATAYPRLIDFEKFFEIAKEVGAYFMVDMAHIAGLVAAKVHPDPIPYADVVTTTTHKTLRGPRGAMILCKKEDRLHPDDNPTSYKASQGKRKNMAQKIDSAVFPGLQGGPLEHIIAAKAVAFGEALKPEFAEYGRQIIANAKQLAKTFKEEGVEMVSGGTDNHLLLLDLTNLGISGKEAETVLDSVGIYTNRNTVPNETRSPFDPSGLRIGTPALTTRGLIEEDMAVVGRIMAGVLKNPKNENILENARKAVKELAEKYPIYPDWSV
ncbi:serine hydroxymethyltransferase [Candidatus Parcubacteria bacterium]|nr:serine hydroxymethyltransferase [Patescibacteria group bacterium]MCG2694385.1 serine hydroxymethyltransferase [Candidatus Parcubacteria bacterium]